MRVNAANGERYPTILETLGKIYRCVNVLFNELILIFNDFLIIFQ